MLLCRTTGTVSANIVSDEYRFNDVNNIQLSVARKNGIKPVANRDELQTEALVCIESCDMYKVDPLTHSVPYLTTNSAGLLAEISNRFQSELKKRGFEKHRVIVTSLLRTGNDVKRLRKVNGNASAMSCHQYATTFDLSYIRFDRLSLWGKSVSNQQLANILGSVLKQLRNEGRCYVKYERKQRCYHITSRT